MSTKITTAFGEAVPPAPRHSVTVHMGGWEVVKQYGADSSKVVSRFKNAYPRMRPHRDIAQLGSAILEFIGASELGCLLFSTLQSAKECVAFSISYRGRDKQPIAAQHISIRVLVANDVIYAVVFPVESKGVVNAFWSTPGAGVSSRFAEANLQHVHELREISASAAQCGERHRLAFNGPLHQTLRERIIGYIRRAPRQAQERVWPSANDVYLYPTGMASIYKPHTYMLEHYNGSTVLFGMAFMNTLNAFEDFGPGYKFFGSGSDEELDLLEAFLEECKNNGHKVQAIWAEFPANPILVTPNIRRLRDLASKYDIVLGIDDTIGSWSNIDITDLVDILVTSLTKSFNGYADAIAGCAILNPASAKYAELKPVFDQHYIPELYAADAETLERNSRDYLARSTRLNANALAIVEYLHSCVQHPESVVRKVHYPSINPSGMHYKSVMRPATADFTPGYGCLFSVELDDLEATETFYDNLNVHKSVHLGAPFTLAFAYTMCTYQKNLAWAAQNGLQPTQIRISAGLEETQTLLENFKVAVEAANKHRRGFYS